MSLEMDGACVGYFDIPFIFEELLNPCDLAYAMPDITPQRTNRADFKIVLSFCVGRTIEHMGEARFDL